MLLHFIQTYYQHVRFGPHRPGAGKGAVLVYRRGRLIRSVRCNRRAGRVFPLRLPCIGSKPLHMFKKPLLNKFEQTVVPLPPNRLVEYFNFDRPAVTGGIHSLPQLAQLDDAIAHHRAAH